MNRFRYAPQRTAFLLILLPLFFSLTALDAQVRGNDTHIYLELWAERDAIIHGTSTPEDRLLREVQYTVSGMTYGFTFEYTPAYRDRAVEERFVMEALHTIPWGDPSVTTIDLTERDAILYGQFLYTPDDTQFALRRRWSSAVIPDSTGSGSGELMDGLDGKFAACEAAVHNAIREYLRGETRNRPRLVSGSILFAEPPRIIADEGRYVARVKIKILLEDIQEYLAF